MRRFWLKRADDETGISGAGHVLDGVVLPSGRVVVEWRGKYATVTVHESMESFRAVHMSPHHAASNELIWIDHENVACRCGHPLAWHLTGGADGRLEYCDGSVNGLCQCTQMQPVEFVERVPDNGYFSEITTVPFPSTLVFAIADAAAKKARA